MTTKNASNRIPASPTRVSGNIKTGQLILHHMARAFFASAWVDQCEECGHSSILSGQEIMIIMPEDIDPSAIHAADTLARDMITVNWPDPAIRPATVERGLELLLKQVGRIQAKTEEHGDLEVTAESFGHYVAMQAMGHGVGLNDAFGRPVYDGIKVPYVEFNSCSLQIDYFNSTYETDE